MSDTLDWLDECSSQQAYDRGRAEGAAEEREACVRLVNAELQSNAVARDRAAASGRTSVASHRQADVETCERLLAAIRARGSAPALPIDGKTK